MVALASTPSPNSPSLSRIASIVDWLAVLVGPLGAAALLGDRGALPAAFDRVRALVLLGGSHATSADLLPWAAALVALSAGAAYALWTRRRWLVWTLAGVAGVAVPLGATGGGLAFAPVACLLTLAAGLRSSLAKRRETEQSDVRF